MEIDQKTWDIDVKEDLGYDGRGSQHIYIELIASPYFYDDDIVRVYMDLDLPEAALRDDTIVYQYMQLLAKDAEEGTDDYISVGCQITVGEEGSEKVDNYLGTSKLDAQSTAGQAVEEQNPEEKDIQRIFFPWSEEWAWYGAYETGNGNKVASCVVEMPIAKDESRDEDIFQEYIVTKGAKLYKDDEDTEPTQIGEEKTKINLGDVNYDADEFIDPEILDLFEPDEDATFDENYIEKEYELQGSTEATLDAATLFGDENAVAAQNFYSVYESNNYLDQDDEISFMFEVDLPTAQVPDGTWIVQMVTLSPTDNSSDKKTIGCLVQVGNQYSTTAVEWEGSADMDFDATGTVKFSEINTGERQTESGVFTIDDPNFYALQTSPLSLMNSIQNCQAKLPIAKQLEDSSIFTTYTALLQARIYTSKDDTNPANLSEVTFEIELTPPVYEAEEFDPYDETW